MSDLQNSAARRITCSDCDNPSRRDFLKNTVGTVATVAGATAGVLSLSPSWLKAAEAAQPTAIPETLVAQLYKTLTGEQRQAGCYR